MTIMFLVITFEYVFPSGRIKLRIIHYIMAKNLFYDLPDDIILHISFLAHKSNFNSVLSVIPTIKNKYDIFYYKEFFFSNTSNYETNIFNEFNDWINYGSDFFDDNLIYNKYYNIFENYWYNYDEDNYE